MLRAVVRLRPAWRTLRRPLTTYEVLDPVKHVLIRPAMYIGSTELTTDVQWIVEDARGAKLALRRCAYVPSVLKVFDEILVNALDARQRSSAADQIDVTIDEASGRISVANNGPGIDVAKHATEGTWIPELVLGNLFAGSNFKDSELRTVGGRHGLGAKLTNIFSSEFSVRTVDVGRALHYEQQWSANMSETGKPTVRKAKTTVAEKKGFTHIEFVLDLPRLGMAHGSLAGSDTARLMRRRVLDAAALAGPTARITLDGQLLPVRDFAGYASACASALRAQARRPAADGATAKDASAEVAVCTLVDGLHPWQLGVGFAPGGNGPEAGISFVNGVHTNKGGSHVALLSDTISKALAPLLAKAVAPLLAKGVDKCGPPRGESARRPFGHRREPAASFPEGLAQFPPPATPPLATRSGGRGSARDSAEFVTPAMVKANLFLAVSALVDNPTFDSQSKEKLTTRASILGQPATLSHKFLKQVAELPGLVEAIRTSVELIKMQLLAGKSKSTSQGLRRDAEKLEDAHLAGGKRAGECTLILTEGDSAKALAVAGLEVVGRQLYGVLPLRGKTLNVRDMPASRISANEEIRAVLASLGISPADGPEQLQKKLRYGRLLLMTDQDHDGSHIKGLVLNLVHHFWPSLLERGDFVSQFVTPIIKFFTLTEYERWRRKSKVSDWSIKYYKGLGTSTSEEARAYFGEMDSHVKRMLWSSEVDADKIDMAFNVGRAADRREWILEATARRAQEEAVLLLPPSAFSPPVLSPPSSTLPPSSTAAAAAPPSAVAQARVPEPRPGAGPGAIAEATVGDFIDRDLVQFSMADCARSLPNALDGLKPSQRKVLFSCFRRKEMQKKEVLVTVLAGYVAEQSAYHHGDASMTATIVHMAQGFVGANSLPLLEGIGQFGTRADGGQNAGAPRYLNVKLPPIARLLFPAADDELLQRVEVDGKRVEPLFYVPVLPVVLLNGANGIGTGWSTDCPPVHPLRLLDNVRAVAALDADAPAEAMREVLRPMQLFAAGFSGIFGPIVESKHHVRALCTGVVEEKWKSGIKLDITELPVGVWNESYMKVLFDLKRDSLIDDFTDHSSERRAHFELSLSEEQLANLRTFKSVAKRSELHAALAGPLADEVDDEQLALLSNLRLVKFVSTRNMNFFSGRGEIMLYPNAESVLVEHAVARRALYAARKAHELRKLARDALELANRSRFIELVNDGRIDVLGGTRLGSVEGKLRELGFARKAHELAPVVAIGSASADEGEAEAKPSAAGEPAADADGDYDYLLGTPLRALTAERVVMLKAKCAEMTLQIAEVSATSERQMWERELDALQGPLELLVAGLPSAPAAWWRGVLATPAAPTKKLTAAAKRKVKAAAEKPAASKKLTAAASKKLAAAVSKKLTAAAAKKLTAAAKK
ncbi:DNA topoisomerase [Pavlovales sp. CCMP2436]|nr:DNA topoisomerase [Pavlovales sp. CCMP2436]